MNANTELAIRLCEEMGIPFSFGTGRITIAGNDVTDVDFSEIFSGERDFAKAIFEEKIILAEPKIPEYRYNMSGTNKIVYTKVTLEGMGCCAAESYSGTISVAA